MVDGSDESLLNVVNVTHCAVERNRPRFFSGPPFAEDANVFCIALFVLGKFHGGVSETDKDVFVLSVLFLIDMVQCFNGFKGNVHNARLHLHLVHSYHTVDEVSQHGCRQECQGMLVGDGCHFCSRSVHLLNVIRR